jgi:hypothetical protein
MPDPRWTWDGYPVEYGEVNTPQMSVLKNRNGRVVQGVYRGWNPTDDEVQWVRNTLRLSCELVPSSCWWANLRTYLSSKDWGRCKAFVQERSGQLCEICGNPSIVRDGGGKQTQRAVDCHEIWVYDDGLALQTLAGLIGLCTRCHEVKHAGLASTKGPQAMGRVYSQLCAVNPGWVNRPEVAEWYVKAEMGMWSIRSDHGWSQDLSWLTLALGIELPMAFQASLRGHVSGELRDTLDS